MKEMLGHLWVMLKVLAVFAAVLMMAFLLFHEVMWGRTPMMHRVAFRGDAKLMRDLVRSDRGRAMMGMKGRLPFDASTADMTPVGVAAGWGHPEVIEVLTNAGASPDCLNAYGMSALHLAVMRGCVESVRLLLDAGATPDLAGKRLGDTALLWAVGMPDGPALAICELLVAAGADPEPDRCREGETPLSRARENGLDNFVQVMQDARHKRWERGL